MKKYLAALWEKRGMVALAYAGFVTLVLPLYVKDGFNMIGDAKYDFFFRGSLLFVGIAFFFLLTGLTNIKQWKDKGLSYGELFALFFLITTVISFLFSPYRQDALWGYMDWHMGMILQGMLVFGFFVSKRWTTQHRLVSYMAWAAALIVCTLTILNRCGEDPLGFYRNMDWFEWNRRNLLATIGNINWLCCYLAVAVPVLLYFGWAAKGYWRIPALFGAWIGLGALFLQGSDAGWMDVGVMLLVLLWMSLDHLEQFIHFWEVAILFPLFWSIFSLFQVDLILPYDVDLMGKCYSPLWLIPTVVILVILLFLIWYQKGGRKDFLQGGKIKKAVRLLIVLTALAALLIFFLCQVSDAVWMFFGSRSVLRMTDEWGSYRGILWKTAWQSYRQAPLIQKLYGVGPDCFVYAFNAMGATVNATGQWENAIYANAHNELLTMLINEGMLGQVTYIGIFISVLIKACKSAEKQPMAVWGVCVILCYLVNNIFAFQQVVSTPFVFVVLGLMDGYVCETKKENNVRGKVDIKKS